MMVQILGLGVFSLVMAPVLVWIWLKPHRAIWALLVGLPVHTLVMVLVFHVLHPPRSLLAVYQGWKDVLLVVALLRVVTIRETWERLRPNWFDAAVLMFGGWAFLQILFHNRLGLGAQLLAFRNDFLLVPAYLLGRLYVAGSRVQLRTLTIIAWVGIAVAAVGIVERFIDPFPTLLALELPRYFEFAYNFTFASPEGLPFSYFQANEARRVGSLFLSPINLAAASGVTLAAGAGLLRARQLSPRTETLALAAMAAAIVGPILAAGRLQIVVTPILLAIAAYFLQRWKLVASLVVLLVALFVIFNATFYTQPYFPSAPGVSGGPVGQAASASQLAPVGSSRRQATSLLQSDDASVAIHLKSLAQAAQDLFKYPLGRGLGSVGLSGLRNSQPATEGQLLVTVDDLGLPGLLLLIWVLAGSLIISWRRARSTDAAGFGLGALLLSASFVLSIPITEIQSYLFVVVATFWVLGQISRERSEQLVGEPENNQPAQLATRWPGSLDRSTSLAEHTGAGQGLFPGADTGLCTGMITAVYFRTD